ncbi:hypothetical protein LF1_50290 [Rubripirellula obstinata]|uniref:Uncharacterized protein n=1 Tax=Rubripirellula obstinata TaxID=406547 RepID=A0A5B1CR70_9BACT|nr:hypothetical protein LF1_50290 [Rubripirellula obstinata]
MGIPRALWDRTTRGAMPNAVKQIYTCFPGPILFRALGASAVYRSNIVAVQISDPIFNSTVGGSIRSTVIWPT